MVDFSVSVGAGTPVNRLPGATAKAYTVKYINERLDYLFGSRPTAVDLSNAIKLLKKVTKNAASHIITVKEDPDCADECGRIRQAYIEAAEKILEDDFSTNLSIGRYGAEYLRAQQLPVVTPIDEIDDPKFFTTSPPGTEGAADMTYRKISVLTHCNTGYTLSTSRQCCNLHYVDPWQHQDMVLR